MVESNDKAQSPGFVGLLGYLLFGAYFAVVLTKSEAVSWFRIQEMFRFQSFHLYGIMLSAVLVAMLSLTLLRKSGARTLGGEPIVVEPKEKTRWMRRYWLGGTLFGIGWALLGACPGPLYALVGYGVTVYVVALVMALLGTWTYGALKDGLPH